MSQKQRQIWFAHGIMTLVLVLGCERTGGTQPGLPNGYRVVSSNRDTVAIAAPIDHHEPFNGQYGVAVGAKITKMNVEAYLVYGEVVSSPHSELAQMEAPGFFLLDTETHKVFVSLTDEELDQILNARGVTRKALLSWQHFVPD